MLSWTSVLLSPVFLGLALGGLVGLLAGLLHRAARLGAVGGAFGGALGAIVAEIVGWPYLDSMPPETSRPWLILLSGIALGIAISYADLRLRLREMRRATFERERHETTG